MTSHRRQKLRRIAQESRADRRERLRRQHDKAQDRKVARAISMLGHSPNILTLAGGRELRVGETVVIEGADSRSRGTFIIESVIQGHTYTYSPVKDEWTRK